MATALVTGPTAGIGNAFARALAREGRDLVLVSRDEARLREVADALSRECGVHVEVLAADLGDREACRRVEQRLADPARPIDLLVNNAGYTLATPFLATDIEAEEQRLNVLVRAVMLLSHAAGQAMAVRGAGSIVNVASVAAFAPYGVYSAHKAWVVSFSQSLNKDLAAAGVRVMALCPGFVHTEFHERAQMDMTALPDWLWLEADEVVATALADLRRGRDVCVPDARYKSLVAGARHLPLRIAAPLMNRVRGAVADRP